jgi:hypothetical protein
MLFGLPTTPGGLAAYLDLLEGTGLAWMASGCVSATSSRSAHVLASSMASAAADIADRGILG